MVFLTSPDRTSSGSIACPFGRTLGLLWNMALALGRPTSRGCIAFKARQHLTPSGPMRSPGRVPCHLRMLPTRT
jgi:hypothetical protein